MSETPKDLPPPYPGNYTDPNQYGAGYGATPPHGYSATSPPGYAGPPPPAGYAPPPQPFNPKDGSYPQQGYPPQGYPPQPQGYTHGTTVVVAQPQVAVLQIFRETPVRTRCIHCQADVISGTHYETGTFAWVVCCVLWWVGLGLGCCLLPFCIDSCKDVIHTCPNCHQQIARYNRM